MDELEELLISGREVNRSLLATVLKPYIRIDRDACKIIPIAQWRGLNALQKVLVYLLARKGMIALGLPLGGEETSRSSIEKDTGLKSGTAGSALFRLEERRLISRATSGGYYVPNYALEAAKNEIERTTKGRKRDE